MSWINPRKYSTINPLIRQAYSTRTPPFAQGARLRRIAYGSMFIQPSDNPQRAQFLTAYTQPLQQFYQTNTFNAPAGDVSPGRRLSQGTTGKVASSTIPIPTNMPWDL
jgi:hypothetical protein